MLQNRSRIRSRRRAQTIVETALMLTGVLLPLSLGVLQFGIIYNTNATLQNIVREGGRFAAVHGQETTADRTYTQDNPPSIRHHISDVCVGTAVKYADFGDAGVEVAPATYGARVSGQTVTVTIKYPMSKKVFLGKFFPGMGLSGVKTYQATFMVE